MQQDDGKVIERVYRQAQESAAADRYEEADRLFRSLLPLLEQLGDRLGYARVLEQIGLLHELRGKMVEARHCYDTALERAPSRAADVRCMLLHRLAHSWRPADPARARKLFLECAALADGLGDRRAAALSRAMVGQIDITAGAPESGMSLLLTALVEIPADSPERAHLIEHAAYLSDRLPRGRFQRLLETHVSPGPLAVALVAALAERQSRR